jgi:peptidoglycan/xylan/chitin deacetylase (PgdA/CDA1 family)
MSIGAHSLSHPVLSEQSAAQVETEITGSRKILTDVLGQPVRAFAYPFGDSSAAGEREFKFAEKAGFNCAFMNVGGTLSTNSSRFSLPRVHISAGMGLEEFEAHVSGLHYALQSRFRGAGSLARQTA